MSGAWPRDGFPVRVLLYLRFLFSLVSLLIQFTIHGESVGLNEYINAERSNRFMAAKIKSKEMDRIMWQLPATVLPGLHHFTFTAYVRDKRKDPDNIYVMFVKFFLDSLVKKGVLENDGQKQVGRITLEPVQIGEPRFEVWTLAELPAVS